MGSPDDFQAVNANFRKIGSKASKQMFLIKPTSGTKYRVVILLENKIIPSNI